MADPSKPADSKTKRSDADSTFREPKLVITRVYTKQGDGGMTSLVGGQRLRKDNQRIEAYGTVDELNAVVGMARDSILSAARERAAGHASEPAESLGEFAQVLLRIQHELFNLGSLLATLPEDVHPAQPQIRDEDVKALEDDMDARNATLPALRSFVLPGGARCNAELHLARTVTRRAERVCVQMGDAAPAAAVQYLNRLSDAFFVWSRWVSATLGDAEVLWQPNQASSGTTAKPA